VKPDSAPFAPPPRPLVRPPPLRIALFEPDIAPNVGTILRLGACLGVGVDVIEPCGFVWSEPKLRRAGMDYLDRVDLRRHVSWQRYAADARPKRLVLLTTRGATRLPEFDFADGDTLLLGRESAGVPDFVHDAADARVAIPLMPGMRSLNVAVAGAIALGQALRQLGGFPGEGQ
jgi:tRNA (cytidine/uridine-2'-O-)-methyltransferase